MAYPLERYLVADKSIKGEPTSNLERVRSGLLSAQSERSIFLAGKGAPLVMYSKRSIFGEQVEFITAPLEGIFDADGLERFRRNLIGTMYRGSEDLSFTPNGLDGIHLGNAVYEDYLGQVRQETTVDEASDADALMRIGYKMDAPETEVGVRFRRTLVRIYPTPALATVVYDNKASLSPDPYLQDLDHWIMPGQMNIIMKAQYGYTPSRFLASGLSVVAKRNKIANLQNQPGYDS
jgi:hypothetical protein